MDTKLPALIDRSCPLCQTPADTNPGLRQGTLQSNTEMNFIGRDRPQSSLLPWCHCTTCGLEYVCASPPEDWFEKLYQTSGETDSILDHQATRTALQLWDDRIQSKTSSILDVGCGRGLFLSSLKNRGLDVCGIEPNQKLREISPLSKNEILSPDDFFKTPKRFDAMSFQLSLEHLFEPKKLLSQLQPFLNDHGLLFILYHSAASIPHRIMGRRSPLYDLQHLQIFTPRTLRKMLEDLSFKTISDMAYANTYSLQYWSRLLGYEIPNRWARRPFSVYAGNRVLVAQFHRIT